MIENEDKILITDRWFDVNQRALTHSVQIKLKNDLLSKKYRNFVIVGGRRTFKTERFIKRFNVTNSFVNNDLITLLGAPTRKQAKDILWDDIIALIKPIYIKDKSETELKIRLKVTNSEIEIIGLKEFQRQEGKRAHVIGITEFQQCDAKVYNQSLQPMINDTRGIAIFDGRPFYKNHFYDFYLRGLNKEKGWSSYHWNAEDILSEEQIEEAKRDLAEDDYNREYKASFDSVSSSPYYAYSQLNNVESYKPLPYVPVIIACDFNATKKPMSWVIGQRANIHNQLAEVWFKTHSYQFTNTERMCDIVLDDLAERVGALGNLEIEFYGDFAGNQEKSNSTYTDWEIIERKFRGKVRTINIKTKQCKSIRNSVGSTNARLKNTLGQIRQYVVYEDCKPLTLDWEKCEWADNKYELKDNDDLRGHCCRAVDYYNDYEYDEYGKPKVTKGVFY